jgi:hypothetical protein
VFTNEITSHKVFSSTKQEVFMAKAKKNDIIAVEETHSMTELHGKTKKYETLFLARVIRSDRQGIVQEFQKIGGTKCKVDYPYRVMTIEKQDKQDLARALAKKLEAEPNKNYYTTPKLLIDAILTGVA